ncbi:LamG domain-containing protein [Fulvivirga sp. M361]|uniref:LamG-like jellyroll fold domain-containing protein n=1 Tax=Fulvivirga sp. M361 TaxID=2594266 RepID=UPI00117B2A4B|nr:LamG-like jellyroll fold domain-containing protein [Fulvivirga sp. M361]TRX47271.1 LamG domain-containing protein [Fulvivirga sp. M361]
MKYLTIYQTIIGVLFLSLLSCESSSSPGFKNALTFYVSFDNGTQADVALGDASIYTADSRKNLDSAEVGMTNTDHEIVKGKGRVGDAFRFGKKSSKVIFYKSKGNIAYDPQNWSGTVSFWLSLDPSTDLEPGFTDPIQITDTRYDDASIWVDFTKENPRDFRLGIIGDKDVWTLDTLNSPVDEELEKRFVRVKKPPFTKNSWTHVLITYDGLGTAQSLASLYLDGKKMGTIKGIDDPFTWELEKSNIYLGLSFIGLMDELAIFNTPLTDDQVMELYQLKGGIKSML